MPKRNLIWLVGVVLVAGLMVWVSRSAPVQRADGGGEFAPVADAYRLIREQYYRPIEPVELHKAAVRGMAESLDEFSSYVDADHVEAFSSRVHGSGRGVGMRLVRRGGGVFVRRVLAGSPAHRAGVYLGDQLVSVDGTPVAGLEIPAVMELLGGEVGTAVEVDIRPPGRREPTPLVLHRERFDIESVAGLCRNAGGSWVYRIDTETDAAYLRVRELVSSTADEVTTALRQIPRVGGLVIDLRDNPGGLLPAAVDLAGLFLHEGTIVAVRDRSGGRRSFQAKAESTLPEVPLVVLIDASTASAAEIVAGALGDHGRAVLVGSRTRGKGCVQSMFALPGELGQINLTTSEFLVAGWRPILRKPGRARWGVDAHVPVAVPPETRRRLAELYAEAGAVGRRTPLTLPAGDGPMRAADHPLVRQILRLDAPLRRGLEVLSDPNEVHILRSQAVARARAQRRATTQPTDAVTE
jgi:carboxyl-terminal processing protease